MNKKWLVIVAACAALGMAATAQAGGDAAAGKAKAKSCVGCHGKDGKGKRDNPPLAGKDAGELAKAMHEFKSGTRKNKMMNRLMKKLSEEDIANLAAYYASLN
ncbi:MAG: c-type cytochrome [Kiloniellaceae bacterium]